MKKIQAIAALLLLAFLSGCGSLTAQTEEAAAPPPENPVAGEILPEMAEQSPEPEQNAIFTEGAVVLDDFDVDDFPVRSEQAISSLVDTLFETKKFREDMNWIFTEMATLNEEAYYQISICSSSDMFSNIGTFWVNADSGAIYLKYDPTLDNKGYFSEFAGDIPEDDGRTRLIAFP